MEESKALKANTVKVDSYGIVDEDCQERNAGRLQLAEICPGIQGAL